MAHHIVVLALTVTFFAPIICSDQRFEFYEHDDYQGYIPFFKSSEEDDGGWVEGPSNCFTLPEYAQQQPSSLKANGNCIMIYTERRCEGRSFKVKENVPSISSLKGKSTHDDFNDLATSIRLCDDGKTLEGSSNTVNVALFAEQNYYDIAQDHSNLCKCVTLPSSFQPKSIDNHHNCIRLFTSSKCDLNQGAMFDLFAGRTSVSEDLTSLPIYGRIASFRPCDTPPACFRLSAEVDRFVVKGNENASSIFETNSRFLSMSTRTVISNHGLANVVQEYSARKQVKESTEIQTIRFDKRIQNWGRITDKSTSFNIGVDIPIEGDIASVFVGLTISNSIKKAYSETYEYAEMNGNRFLTETTTEFGVKQLIEVGPCSAYSVDSMVKVVENYPMSYQMYFTLQGEHANKRMTANELIEEIGSMSEYTYNHTVDEFTVTVFSTADITASFGVETEIKGEGKRILDCP